MLDAKVIGPILLAKHLADLIRPGGGFVFFSGIAAWKPGMDWQAMYQMADKALYVDKRRRQAGRRKVGEATVQHGGI